jgi:cytochrome c biogenesis protein CcdA
MTPVPTPTQGQIELTWIAVVIAGLTDAFNPCTIAIMVMLLSTILLTGGRQKMLLAALTFIGVIFVCYVLVGLGIYHVIQNTNLINGFYLLMTVLTFVMMLMEFNAYFNYRPGFMALEMPMFLRPYSKQIIAKATTLPGVAVAALFCSLFLLPCSSGPYLVILSMLGKVGMTTQAIFYILLYNVFFVLPMTIIAFGIYFGQTTVEKVAAARETYIRQIHLVAGILFFILFIMMLSQLTGFKVI